MDELRREAEHKAFKHAAMLAREYRRKYRIALGIACFEAGYIICKMIILTLQ